MGYLSVNFSLPRPFCCRLRPDVRDRQTSDRQTLDAHHRLMPLPKGRGITIRCQLGKLTTAENFKEQETQLTLTNRATHLCKCSGVADLLKYGPPHICYQAEFRRSALKGVSINTGETQKLGSPGNPLLGWEAWLTPRYTSLPTCVTKSYFVDLRQRMYA